MVERIARLAQTRRGHVVLDVGCGIGGPARRRAPRFAASAPQPWRPVTIGGFMSALEAGGLEDIRALAWPGRSAGGSPRTADPALTRDLRDGLLIPQLVLARRL